MFCLLLQLESLKVQYEKQVSSLKDDLSRERGGQAGQQDAPHTAGEISYFAQVGVVFML